MNINYRRRVNLTNNVWVNLGKSGASLSVRMGRVTFNSRRGLSLNAGHGVSVRS